MSVADWRTRWSARVLAGGLLAACLLFGGSANAFCFARASQVYGVPKPLLLAIAEQESGFNPNAQNKNTNGTRDIGLMQINTWWMPQLSARGITAADLLDPCVNVLVGAWILSENFARWGYSQGAIAAYNTGKPTKGHQYAAQVLQRAQKYQ